MKKLLLLSAILIFACNSGDSTDTNDYIITYTELINCDGNPVPAIVYGTQEWTVENACHKTYRDGTPIPEITDADDWNDLSTGAWCYYENDPTKGVLYNWYAVAGIYDEVSLNNASLRKEFAPQGWHVPSESEFSLFVYEYLPTNGYNGKDMASTTGWDSSTNTGAVGNDQSLNNSTGFDALPVGIRNFSGDFLSEGKFTAFRISEEVNEQTAFVKSLRYDGSGVSEGFPNKEVGYAVRLIRD